MESGTKLLEKDPRQKKKKKKKPVRGGGFKPQLLFMHQQRRKKQPSQGGCVPPYICVVPASYVTACSRDGAPWEPGEDSLTCRCLRPTCASNLVVTWGGGGRLSVCVCVHGEGSVMMIMKKRLVRL